jgi:cytochrome b subunit of formate dehydrogenase
MHLFRYARDYYGDSSAQQLMVGTAILFAAVVFIFVGIHLVRRSFGRPVTTEAGEKLPADFRLLKYEIGARLYHWGNMVFLGGLAFTGVALFTPPAIWKARWLLLHEIFAALFIAGLGLHVAVAPLRGEGRSMWFERRDWRDLKLISANFIGLTREYPAFGKYDPLQKLYHAFLTVLSAAVIFSGIYLVLSAEIWASLSHEWMRIMRLMHDTAAFAFIAIIAGHIYFGVIRVNWPELAAMITGRLPGSYYNLYHNTERWKPAKVERRAVGK